MSTGNLGCHETAWSRTYDRQNHRRAKVAAQIRSGGRFPLPFRCPSVITGGMGTRSRPGLLSVTHGHHAGRNKVTWVSIAESNLLIKHDKGPPNMVDRSSMPPKSPIKTKPKSRKKEENHRHQRRRTVGAWRAEGRSKNGTWSLRLSTVTLLAADGGGAPTGRSSERTTVARLRLRPADRDGSPRCVGAAATGTAATPAPTGRSSK